MRIIAGSAKGRALQGPGNSKDVRPTADRVRETVFNVLGQWLDGCRVLDLFSGTGALGLEALSRGAQSATLVDVDLSWAKKNAAALGFAPVFIEQPALRALAMLQKRGEKFDLVFSDPPYALEAGSAVLEAARPLLNPDGRVVLEHGKRESVPEEGRVDQRRFGDTVVSIFSVL
ncbi:MAG: 16S rRNA (guanine(966)-N(2))-methyltransferase RsmD [Archangiaceae bacterium]|nr:16S rRNA (guanine(966)-N(2))-methyltransferase RsmD [Archangiaceae bacterium]